MRRDRYPAVCNGYTNPDWSVRQPRATEDLWSVTLTQAAAYSHSGNLHIRESSDYTPPMGPSYGSRRPLGAFTAAAAVLVVFVMTTSCVASSTQRKPSVPSSEGTLRVAVVDSGSSANCTFVVCADPQDPQTAGYTSQRYELERCCLLRTLLATDGRDVAHGGSILRPDLASSLPDVSSDGLTWTFHLRRGVRYGPPMQAETVQAQDFVRAIERALSPLPAWLTNRTLAGPYLDNFFALYLHAVDVIVGAKAYGEGKAQHISGLETPDDYTLVVHLTHPSGEFGYAMAVPELAPIPPVPSHPEWPWGTAQGHEGTYFSYLVSIGPYMIAGAPQLDFSKPPQDQLPVSGNAPDGFTLVRNPSWQPSSDPLRRALPDRIEYVPVKDPRSARRLVANGAIDFPLSWPTPPRLLSRSDAPVSSAGSFFFLFLNLATRPLNDVHVRRAIAFAIRRQRFVANLRKLDHVVAVPATHMGFNDQENNLLLNYDPYQAATGDLKAARREMAKSRYDSNHDGRCDGRACHFAFLDAPGFHDQALDKGLARDLKRIGLDVHVHITTRDLNDPKVRDPMVEYGWLKNSVGASTFFNLAFGGPPFRTTGAVLLNFSQVGAQPAELKSWGYHITHVPSLDAKLGRCLALTFSEQTQCYAELDQFITTRLVPSVPLAWGVESRLTSKRVAGFNFDPFPVIPLPSLDRVVLRPDTKLAPMPHHTHPAPLIPEGMYRFKLSRADLLRFDPHADPNVIQNETGVVTVNLRKGMFAYLTYAPRPMDFPMAIGIYQGHGNEVSFQIQRTALGSPPGLDGSGVLRVPTARWRFDGQALHFKLLGCGKLSRTQCEDIRAIYEAHPWVKVADLP